MRREDIEEFRAKHVFGRALAILLGRPAKKTMQLLAERAIHPLQADDAEACRQLIYRLDQPLRDFLAETGKLSLSIKLAGQIECSKNFSLRHSC